MAKGRFTEYLVGSWLDGLQNSYLALHYDDPDVAGAYASELFGGSYIRKRVTFTSPNSRAIWNAGVITFTGLPSAQVTHLGLWDATVNGNLLMSTPLEERVITTAGGRFTIPEERFAVSFR